MRVLLLVLCFAPMLGLAGCGKKGSPVAPGPSDQVIYPRTYPAY